MADPNFSEIVTTTLRNRTGALADNISENNALLNRMKKKGSLETVSGGRTIVQELEYAENASAQWYSGYEQVNINPSDVFSAAEFDWKQASVAVSASGLEVEVQNTGKEAIIKLASKRISNAEKTMANLIATALYADGTGTTSKEIGGLQLLVPDDPTTGTVGGISRVTWTFWRSLVYDASSDGGAAASAANIQAYINTIYNRAVRGTDHTDLIMADSNYYGFFESSLQAIQRITDPEMATLGYESLKYKGAAVVLDGGVGGNCPTNHMYGLNSEYIKFRPHSGRNMVPLEKVQAINQDATVKLIVFAGNMTLSNAMLQWVLKA
jgi:outer membrane protein assembly factor BamB